METVRLPQHELLDALRDKPRHVLITGASRGIGEAIARRLGAGEFRLSLAARSYNRLLGVVMDVGQDKAHAVKLDLEDERSIDDAIVSAESKFGPIDAVIANAGINEPTAAADLTAAGRARFRRVMEVNVNATYFATQLAAAHMPEGGHIVFIGSVLARFGAAGSIAYTASKHALLGVTRALAAELAPRRIKVNCVNPGFVDTKMAQDVLRRLAAERGVSLQEITNEMLGGQPFARMVRPAEVAAYVDFLLGPGGEAITGQGVDISCGSVMV